MIFNAELAVCKFKRLNYETISHFTQPAADRCIGH